MDGDGMARKTVNSITQATEDARGAAAGAVETVKNAATSATARGQQFAEEAGRRTTAAAQSAYGTGNDVLGLIEDAARENIGLALLVAGCVGYGLACLVKTARR